MPLTGSRSQDRTRVAAISRIPENSMYTWHHHEAAGIMMLVNRTVHLKHGHVGGVFFHEILTGKNIDYNMQFFDLDRYGKRMDNSFQRGLQGNGNPFIEGEKLMIDEIR